MATAVASAADPLHSNPNPNPNPDSSSNGGAFPPSADRKKSRESERRRRRRKQKKNKSVSAGDGEESDAGVAGEDSSKENDHPNNHKIDVAVEVEYVPEKAEFEGSLLEDFKSVFEKFSFNDTAPVSEEEAKKEEASDAAKKRVDSDSDEEEQDGQQKKDGAVSNKKRKLQRRMKIAELKQICSRPDVVEVWDVTAADPKLLVYLKSYRNTVPVPRHWCQKRKFLQGWRWSWRSWDWPW